MTVLVSEWYQCSKANDPRCPLPIRGNKVDCPHSQPHLRSQFLPCPTSCDMGHEHKHQQLVVQCKVVKGVDK